MTGQLTINAVNRIAKRCNEGLDVPLFEVDGADTDVENVEESTVLSRQAEQSLPDCVRVRAEDIDDPIDSEDESIPSLCKDDSDSGDGDSDDSDTSENNSKDSDPGEDADELDNARRQIEDGAASDKDHRS